MGFGWMKSFRLAWMAILVFLPMVLSAQTSGEPSIELERQKDNTQFTIVQGRSHIAVRTESKPWIRKGKVNSIQPQYIVLDSDTIPIAEITVVQGNLMRGGVLDYTKMRTISIVMLSIIGVCTLIFVVLMAPSIFSTISIFTAIYFYIRSVGILWAIYLILLAKRYRSLHLKRDFWVNVRAKS